MIENEALRYVFYSLTEFHCLMALTSWDIGQYVCCNYLLSIL